MQNLFCCYEGDGSSQVMASGLQAEDFFDEAEDITDISIPSGIKENEELVRTFNSVDHRQLEMTLGVIDILERGEWLAQVK